MRLTYAILCGEMGLLTISVITTRIVDPFVVIYSIKRDCRIIQTATDIDLILSLFDVPRTFLIDCVFQDALLFSNGASSVMSLAIRWKRPIHACGLGHLIRIPHTSMDMATLCAGLKAS